MLNKVLQSKFIVKNTDNYLIKLGLITYQNESKFHRLFRHSLTTLGFILLGKFWLSILIWILKSNDINHCKQWIMYLGDLTLCFPKIRIHFNMLLSMFVCQCVVTQLAHNKLICDEKFHDFKWMKLFHMLNGKLKPSQIGFTHSKDLIEFAERFDS